MTSYIGMKTASITVSSTSIALRSDAGCPGKDRIGKSSHYSDARRSMDSHRGTLGPIFDESVWLRVTSTPKDCRRADSLRGRLHHRPRNFDKRMSLESVCTRDTKRSLPRHEFTGARHDSRSRSSTFRDNLLEVIANSIARIDVGMMKLCNCVMSDRL
jgi:hypothetical protein